MRDLLQLGPVKKFIEATGGDIKKYFGKDDACIIYLEPDGVFYGEALHQWLMNEGKENVVLTAMDSEGNGLDEGVIRGRKVLVVDNDVFTGKGYRQSMGSLRSRRKKLGVRDIKFASFSDRVGVADFSAGKYSAEAIWHPDEIDVIDLKIIRCLAQDGRLSLADIGKKVHLSSVAVKNRVDKLQREKILHVHGSLNIDQFYTMSAQIGIEAEDKTVMGFIEKFEKVQEIYYLVRSISGKHNLQLGILAHNLENIERFVENEIREVPGVKHVDVYVGGLPIVPKTISPKF